MIAFLFVLPLMLGTPVPTVNWVGEHYDAVAIGMEGSDGLLDDCLQSGLTLEYRYEMELCAPRRYWFDDCGATKEVRQRLQYNTITGQYTVTADRHGDEVGPTESSFEEKGAAITRLQSLEPMKLTFLGSDERDSEKRRPPYMRVRIISVCKGEVNKTVARLSYLLTLGMFRLTGFNTGWTEFELRKIAPLITS